MSVIDDYLKNVAEPQRAELERVRGVIKEAAPDANEVITYSMPGFKYKNKYLISFSAFKDHLSIFPGAEVIAALGNKLAGFKTSKGTIQFTLEAPLSDQLIKEIVELRKADIERA